MNVGQALLHMAELWDYAQPNDGDYYVLDYVYGLCDTALDMYIERLICETVLGTIRQLIIAEPFHYTPFEVRADGYKWPLTLEGAKARAEWCREQAAKLEKVIS